MRTNRNSRKPRKTTWTLTQDPNFPAPIPLPAEQKPAPDYQDSTRLAALAKYPRDGITVIMPAVQQHWPVAATDDTQVLPVVSEPLPPSARHVDPVRRYYEQTFVEDDGLEPESRGKHVLAELKAEPDLTQVLTAEVPDLVNRDVPDPALQSAASRIVAAMTPPVEGLAGAVRIARRAYRASQISRRWFGETESRLEASRRRIAEFNKSWDEQLRDWNAALCGQEAVNAGYSLAAAYEENKQRIAEANARRAAEGMPPLDATPTSFTRGMQAELKDLILQRATAGSGVAA